MTLDEVRHILRSDTDVPMPLIEERHRILNETGKILLEKFGGSFLNCVQKSETGLKQGSMANEGLMDVAICGLSFSLFCLNYNLLLGATCLPQGLWFF